MVANGGVVPQVSATLPSGKKRDSAKMRGVKQGAFLFLSGILLVPILGIIHAALNATPYLVGITAIVCFVGGLVRMLYAGLFEEGASSTLGANFASQFMPNQIAAQQQQNALPPQQSIPVSDYVQPGRWRETTNELAEPGSVTDSTTKLLERDTQ